MRLQSLILTFMPSRLQDVVREMLILRHVQKRKLRRHIKRHITEMSAAQLTGTVQSQCIRLLQSFACIAIRMVLLAVMVTSLLHSLVMNSYVTTPNTS